MIGGARRWRGWLVMGGYLLGVPACGSETEPVACEGSGSLPGDEACARLAEAFAAKCQAQVRCDVFVRNSGCTTTDRYCEAGVERALADFAAAPSCEVANAVTVRLICF